MFCNTHVFARALDASTYESQLAAEKQGLINKTAERRKAAQENKSGCFIATVCYGSYVAPEVLVLRQYRDSKLLKTYFGKVFVKFYYFVSPFFAMLISKSDLLKNLVRRYFLKPIVTKLQR
jgi:hypothetical protein